VSSAPRSAAIAALVSLAIVACWRSSPPPPASPPVAEQSTARPQRVAPPMRNVDIMFEAMERFTDDMCRCQDAPCAQRVSEDLTRWAQDQAKTEAEQPQMTEEDQKRAMDIGQRMGTCMQNAMMGSGAGSSGTLTP